MCSLAMGGFSAGPSAVVYQATKASCSDLEKHLPGNYETARSRSQFYVPVPCRQGSPPPRDLSRGTSRAGWFDGIGQGCPSRVCRPEKWAPRLRSGRDKQTSSCMALRRPKPAHTSQASVRRVGFSGRERVRAGRLAHRTAGCLAVDPKSGSVESHRNSAVSADCNLRAG